MLAGDTLFPSSEKAGGDVRGANHQTMNQLSS